MNDQQLRHSVIDQWDFEPGIDAAAIGVAAEEGVVTLTGHLPTYPQKVAAERATWRVKGIQGIAQEIKVRFTTDKKHHDDEIAQRVLKILAWNSSIPSSALRVKVRDGLVTLSGHVDWNYEREGAEAAVRRLEGVRGVLNQITLQHTVQAADVKRRIRDALTRHAQVESSRIQVDVGDDGRIRLDGQIGSFDERLAVLRAAWSVRGVRTVDDWMTIH